MIDSNLYLRQLGLYVFETQKNIMKLNILIYGMRGIGVEITKNIVLTGPKSVTIYDPNIAEINDLSSNFYLTKDDIENKRRRDESIKKKISGLNPYVSTKVIEGDNILENINNSLMIKELKYDVVVLQNL